LLVLGMKSARDIADFLGRQPSIMPILRTVAALDIDDCWVGAGLIRNAVWDHLHGLPIDLIPGSDVDVIYCDHASSSLERDLAIEQRLARCLPGIPWSVHNQARMHERNGDAPYVNSADAIRRWPETATAIAARLSRGELQLLAPHGVADLVGLIVRPSPAFSAKIEIYESRIASKDWGRRWPKLRFVRG
jgi:uncharacterized protein